MKKLFILVMILLVANVCWAADLNAPAQKQVTVGSELERGSSAMRESCSGKIEVSRVLDSINFVLDTNKQNNTNTDAFLLGAYLNACLSLDYVTEHNYKSDDYIKIGKDSLAYYYKELRKKQNLLGVDDQQLCDAVGMNYDNVKVYFDKWYNRYN